MSLLDIATYEGVFVCVRVKAPSKAWGCKALKDTIKGGVVTGVVASTTELETDGLEIQIYSDSTLRTRITERTTPFVRGTKLGLGTLCNGLKYIGDFTPSGLKNPSVSFFLDPVP